MSPVADSETSVDSDYSSEGSDRSSPCHSSPVPTVVQPQYYIVLPPGYHFEVVPLEPEQPTFNPETSVDRRGPSFQRRLIKWSLPPPPVQPANLPGWTAMP